MRKESLKSKSDLRRLTLSTKVIDMIINGKNDIIYNSLKSNDRGHIVFVLFVCLSVVNFNLSYNF